MNPSATYPAMFDTQIDRRAWSTKKWDKYQGTDILPFWIADMDFPAPPFIRDAIQARLDHGVLGYGAVPPELTSAFLNWSASYCKYAPAADALVWVPGVVASLNIAARALARDGGAIATTTPIYYPFLDVAANAGQRSIELPLVAQTLTRAGVKQTRWEIDFDAMAHALDGETVSAILFCNPHNPTGRMYTEAELTAFAEFCLRRNIRIISDEIHCPLVLEPSLKHLSLAALDPEIAAQTITLQAPTKAWNLAGVSASVAIIEDVVLRERFCAARAGMISNISVLAYAAAAAAYADTSPYLQELCSYLRQNHDRLQTALAGVAPDLAAPVEATYLAWIDVRGFPAICGTPASPVNHSPGQWFESHGLGLSDGRDFAGDGFVRFNFAAPAELVDRGIDRLVSALNAGH